MQLTRRQSGLLVGAAAWTWYVWLSRIFNIVGDQTRSAQFKAVHIALALVSVVLLTPVGIIGIKGLKASRSGSGTPGVGEGVPARRP